MTAPTRIDPVTLGLSLPYREHRKEPAYTDRPAHLSWSIERLVEYWAESGDEWPIGLIHHFRPDLTPPQIEELALALCNISADVFDLQNSMSGRWPEFDALCDNYTTALRALVDVPVTA